MGFSMRKYKAIYKKDLRDMIKNPAIFLCCLVPILMVVAYKFIFSGEMEEGMDRFILLIGTVMNCVMTGCLVPSTSISEEKEKFTLRTLMLSNVSAWELFLAKMSVALTGIVVAGILMFLIAGAEVTFLPLYLLVTLAGAVPLILISCVIGIVCRDQNSCSVYQIPVMFLFMLPPLWGAANPTVGKIAEFTPCNAMMMLYFGLSEGSMEVGELIFQVLVLTVWITMAAILFKYFYEKKGRDN